MGLPVPHIEIETPPAIDLFLPFFGKVGMAQDDDFKTFQELLMGKRFEGRGRGGSIRGMIFLITPVAQPPGDVDGEARAR